MITSTSNARVKQLLQLRKKARERNAQDLFVVEGPKMYQETPPERIVQVCVSEKYYQKNQALFEGGGQVTVLSDRVFESVSDTRTPQGVLCIVRQYHYELPDLLCGDVPLIMALENLQDPGNLGTIVRMAEGAGATGILLGPGCVDIYNPKTIRSTMGSIYRVPFYYTDDLKRDLCVLRDRGVRWFAAHLEGSVPYDEESYVGSSGFLIGNESQGLTSEITAAADARIRIPMCGKVESLNAAIAASVLMYEANRQRRAVRF
ncbi:MAG: RNA methyltransferase [Lachnospiraceae bacterium]|nr:RNA methyltransferase [Lachnospiraceae bacterium]